MHVWPRYASAARQVLVVGVGCVVPVGAVHVWGGCVREAFVGAEEGGDAGGPVSEAAGCC